MIKYVGSAVSFEEVPDEISLVLQITGCPYHCEECHSPYLQEDTGGDLEKALPALLDYYGKRVTCVCFMGEGKDLEALGRCLLAVKNAGLKTAVYTGSEMNSWEWRTSWPFAKALFSSKYDVLLGDAPLHPDYLKTGPYEKKRGPLNNPSTNQHMYERKDGKWKDITNRFW